MEDRNAESMTGLLGLNGMMVLLERTPRAAYEGGRAPFQTAQSF